MSLSRMASTAGLFVCLVANADAQSTVPSVDELSSTLQVLRPANRAILRARRMSGRSDQATADRKRIAELRELIQRLEQGSLDRGKFVVSQDQDRAAGGKRGDKSSESTTQARKRLRDWLARNKVAPRQAQSGAGGRRNVSAMRRKTLRNLLDDVEAELDRPERLGITRIRDLKDRTKLEPGPLLERTGNETPTITTIVKHRRELW